MLCTIQEIKPKNMNINRIVIYLLTIKFLAAAYFIIKYFNLPTHLDLFEIVLFAKDFIIMTGLCSALLGFYQSYKARSLTSSRFFNLSLQIGIADIIFYIVFLLYSPKSSFFNSGLVALKILDIAILSLVAYSFIYRHESSLDLKNTEPVTRLSRFFNLSIDTLVILTFAISNMALLKYQGLMLELDITNWQTYLFYAFHSLTYYFILEIIFLQTIGKLHNNSQLKLNKPRFPTIIVRTLSRKIPFDALSFLIGKNGWHDTLSETSVVRNPGNK